MQLRSILQQKAEKRKILNISRAPMDVQVNLYRETLTDLEEYLDTEDLRKLNSTSMGVIKEDVLKIIKGSRELKPKLSPGSVVSMDGILENLRVGRDNLQVAHGMFDQESLKEGKSDKFFKELRLARKNIAEALKWF